MYIYIYIYVYIYVYIYIYIYIYDGSYTQILTDYRLLVGNIDI